MPLNTRIIRNAVWSHFEKFTCHVEDEYVSRTQHNCIDDEVSYKNDVEFHDCLLCCVTRIRPQFSLVSSARTDWAVTY